MPVESAADRAAFFNVDEFAAFATYTAPGGGAAATCSVLFDATDEGARDDDGRPSAGQTSIAVRKSEIDLPEFGGTFELPDRTLTIVSRPRLLDHDGDIWTMWTAES